MNSVNYLDLNATRPLYCKVSGCHVSCFYHLGFCYMMLRRVYDAIQIFSHILLFLAKSRSTAQYTDRSQEKIFALLLICVTLCPTNLDEQITKLIQEKYSDVHNKLQSQLSDREDTKLAMFEDKFNFGCPKFIIPGTLDEAEEKSVNEAHQVQLKRFINEVREMKMVPTITSYLKLYTAISVDKLAKFCSTDPTTLRTQLQQVKQKTRQLVHPADSNEGPQFGEERNCGDIEFDTVDNKIMVRTIKEEAPYSQVFLKNVTHFKEIIQSIEEELN